MMAANACNAFALLLAFWHTPQLARVLIWTAVVFCFSAYVLLRRRRGKPIPAPRLISQNAIYRVTAYAFALGVCWAMPPLVFFPEATPGAQLLIACLSAGMLCGGAFALAGVPSAALSMVAPIALGSFIRLIGYPDREHLLTAIVLCVYAAVLIVASFSHAQQLRSRLLKQIRAERQGQTDPLTRLRNRLGFEEALERELARIERGGDGFALLCVDLNNFKLVNDQLGHAAGDALLVEVAQRMRASSRKSDFIARIGGDEFVILVSDVERETEAMAAARRFFACFETPFVIDGHSLFSAASFGVAIAPLDGRTQRALMRSADIALYQAKRRGEIISLFDSHHDDLDRETRVLEADLRRALPLGQLSLELQPVLNIRRNEIVGCEALLRWRHAVRGDIDPGAFIPLAEKTGLIDEIGMWVVDNVCEIATRLPERLRIAFNVSPVQLRDPAFAENVLDRIQKTGVSPGRVEIEITESTLLANNEQTDNAIRRLSNAGIAIALDDFGMGYSSLTYLRKLPLQKIKIDRAFTHDVIDQPDCTGIVQCVIQMGRLLDKTIVAEGVENEAQLEWLRIHGCTEAQGYFIAAPMSEADFGFFLRSFETAPFFGVSRPAPVVLAS
jgi:diguanylate cyclase (GGDEF)-like protein